VAGLGLAFHHAGFVSGDVDDGRVPGGVIDVGDAGFGSVRVDHLLPHDGHARVDLLQDANLPGVKGCNIGLGNGLGALQKQAQGHEEDRGGDHLERESEGWMNGVRKGMILLFLKREEAEFIYAIEGPLEHPCAHLTRPRHCLPKVLYLTQHGPIRGSVDADR
jgi:hypothetical protein